MLRGCIRRDGACNLQHLSRQLFSARHTARMLNPIIPRPTGFAITGGRVARSRRLALQHQVGLPCIIDRAHELVAMMMSR